MSTSPADFNAQVVDEFHANEGRVGGMFQGIPMLLLHHVGAKSGKSRVNPLAYLSDGGRYVVIASNGGALSSPGWYHNLKANPDVTIEVGTETIDVVASETTGEERERLFRTQTERSELGQRLPEYEQQAGRLIPVIVLEPNKLTPPQTDITDTAEVPVAIDRATFQAELDALRVREKAHTRAGDALAAARRRLAMVEVDSSLPLIGPRGRVRLLDAFEGRQQLIAYFHMWYAGQPAADQCEGCTFFNGQVRELSFLHSRDVTYAALCQGPFEESVRYRDFMGWEMPWYSAQDSAEALLAGRGPVNKFYLVCYLRRGDRVFETYWTNGRGVEAMDINNALLDLTVYGRQETWEDSPAGWPRRSVITGEPHSYRTNGRPIAQWSRLTAGRSDDLGAAAPPIE